MVLPVRIELTTSALPRMRSTTELRQHRQPPSGQREAALWPAGGGFVKRRANLTAAATCAMKAAMGKEDTGRATRLAEALRQNLRRRKAQARALPDPAAPPPMGEPEP